MEAHEVHLMRELHMGEAVPGTALHRAAGRLGAAPATMRAQKAEQRGWLSKGDIERAERAAAQAKAQARAAREQGGIGGGGGGHQEQQPASKPKGKRVDDDDLGHEAIDGGTVGARTWMP